MQSGPLTLAQPKSSRTHQEASPSRYNVAILTQYSGSSAMRQALNCLFTASSQKNHTLSSLRSSLSQYRTLRSQISELSSKKLWSVIGARLAMRYPSACKSNWYPTLIKDRTYTCSKSTWSARKLNAYAQASAWSRLSAWLAVTSIKSTELPRTASACSQAML